MALSSAAAVWSTCLLAALLTARVAAQAGAPGQCGGPGQATCCGNDVCDPGEDCTSCARDCTRGDGRPCQRIGMFYSTWHLPAFTAVSNIKAMGKPVLSVEDVLRSRDDSNTGTRYSLGDMISSHGQDRQCFNMYYQHGVLDGYYCIYHGRSPGDVNYNADFNNKYMDYIIPDCPGWQSVVKRHALLLSAAGVDFIVPDMTNAVGMDPTGDAIQLRPLEILTQEWMALRAQGIKTPDVSAWQRLPLLPSFLGDGGDWMYKRVLDVMNQPQWDNMFFRDPASRKKVYFVPRTGDFDQNFVGDIESNGGRNDILTVGMWINGQANGDWTFFAPCMDPATGAMIAVLSDSDCNQAVTANSPMGSQMSVAPSYQLTYATKPFTAIGVYNGHTFRKQFKTAIGAQPDYILLSSWNEQTAAPLIVGQGPTMGLEDDPVGSVTSFTDIFGAEFSRDIEASTEFGYLLYDIMASCLRVFRNPGAHGFPPADPANICDDATEVCCSRGKFSDMYAYYGGSGPGDPAGFALFSPKLTPDGQIRRALYECSAGSVWLSADSGCDGSGAAGRFIGSVASRKQGFLRGLFKCGGPGSFSWALSDQGGCTRIGYVR